MWFKFTGQKLAEQRAHIFLLYKLLRLALWLAGLNYVLGYNRLLAAILSFVVLLHLSAEDNEV